MQQVPAGEKQEGSTLPSDRLIVLWFFPLSICKVMNFQNQELPLEFFLQSYQPLLITQRKKKIEGKICRTTGYLTSQKISITLAPFIAILNSVIVHHALILLRLFPVSNVIRFQTVLGQFLLWKVISSLNPRAAKCSTSWFPLGTPTLLPAVP